MDQFLHTSRDRAFPGRFACSAVAIGIIGLLLVSLIVWVERLEATAPDVKMGPPVQRAAPCDIIEPRERRSELLSSPLTGRFALVPSPGSHAAQA
jgi:hypothetical protein